VAGGWSRRLVGRGGWSLRRRLFAAAVRGGCSRRLFAAAVRGGALEVASVLVLDEVAAHAQDLSAARLT
jgi:hypothetical protein